MTRGVWRFAPCLCVLLVGCGLAQAARTGGGPSGTLMESRGDPGRAPAARQQAICTRARLCADVEKLQAKSEEEKVIDTLLSPLIIAAVCLRLFASVVETSARKAPGWASFAALLTLDSSTRVVVIVLAGVELHVLSNNGSKGTLEFNGLLAATTLDSAITISAMMRLLACFACFIASRRCTLLSARRHKGQLDEWDLWDYPFSSDPIAVGIHDQAERSVRQHELINDAARLVLQNTEYVWGSLGLVMLVGSLLDALGFALMLLPGGGSLQKWWRTRLAGPLRSLAAIFKRLGGSHHFTRWLSGMSARTNRMVFAGSWLGYLRREVHHRCVLALVLNGHYEDKHVVALDEELSRQGLPGKPLFVVQGRMWDAKNNVREGDYFPPLAPTYGMSMSILVDRSLSAEAFCRRLLGVVDERLRVVSRILDDGFFLATKQTLLRQRLKADQHNIRWNTAVPSLVLDPSRNASHVARVALFANTLRGLLLDPKSTEEQEHLATVERDPVPTDDAAGEGAMDFRSRLGRCFSGLRQPRRAGHRQLGEEETQLSVELFYGLKVLSTRHNEDAFILQKGYWWSRATLNYEAFARAESEKHVPASPGAEASSSPVRSLFVRAIRISLPAPDAEPTDDSPPSTPDELGDGRSSLLRAVRSLRHGSAARRAVNQPPGTPRPAANAMRGTLLPAWSTVGAALQHFSELGLMPWMVASDLGIEELDGVYVAMGRHHQWSEVERVNYGGDALLREVLFDIQEATTQLRQRLAEPMADPTTTRDWVPAKLYPDVPARLLSTLNKRSRVPLTCVPDEVAAVFIEQGRPAELRPLDEMLDWWHAKWRAVLEAACTRDSVPVEHVRRLPLVGWYPSMRLALDAYAGKWEPIEAAMLSLTASIVHRPGRSTTCERRLQTMRMEMEARKKDWPMRRVRATSMFATILLSASTAEASLYRRLLHVTDAEDRRARGASSASETAVGVRNAFASVALTGRLVAMVTDTASTAVATRRGNGAAARRPGLPANGGGDAEQRAINDFAMVRVA